MASSRADYESPEAQIYSSGDDFSSATYACLRATGKQRKIGNTGGGEGSEATTLLGVYGRWVWLQYAMYDPDADSRDVEQSLLDLRTGKQSAVSLGDGESGIEARALPGALVATGGGVVARFTEAPRRVNIRVHAQDSPCCRRDRVCAGRRRAGGEREHS